VIVVKIELWSAVTGKSSELGRMYIANDGTGTSNNCDYDAVVCRRGSKDVPQPLAAAGPKPTRKARVENYPRLSYNVWRLVLRALRAAFPEEK